MGHTYAGWWGCRTNSFKVRIALSYSSGQRVSVVGYQREGEEKQLILATPGDLTAICERLFFFFFKKLLLFKWVESKR